MITFEYAFEKINKKFGEFERPNSYRMNSEYMLIEVFPKGWLVPYDIKFFRVNKKTGEILELNLNDNYDEIFRTAYVNVKLGA